MNSKRTKKPASKKIRLTRLAEEDPDELQDDLLTEEEMRFQEEDKKIQKHVYKNKNVRTESLAEEWIVSQQKLKREDKRKGRSQLNDTDQDIEDEEEDIIGDIKEADVKGIIQDVIKKKVSSQKANQDYFCSVLAQLIFKNKINKENAFEIPLPDVKDMSDFAKVSEASWQKLSSSLDSGSKIYGYRVDSLHQESFKVLGGLMRSEVQYGKSKDNEGDNDQEDDSEEMIHKEREKLLKKQKRTHEDTIEKNIMNITLTRYDIQFEVDPLFCKTSAKFDDASSKGILLNNIRIDANLKLMMDSESLVTNDPPSKMNSAVKTTTDCEDVEKEPLNKISNAAYQIRKTNAYRIRSDLNELELCTGLEKFISTMLTFDDSNRKKTKEQREDFFDEGGPEEILMKDVELNGQEEEMLQDIQYVMTQTAQKRREVFLSNSDKSKYHKKLSQQLGNSEQLNFQSQSSSQSQEINPKSARDTFFSQPSEGIFARQSQLNHEFSLKEDQPDYIEGPIDYLQGELHAENIFEKHTQDDGFYQDPSSPLQSQTQASEDQLSRKISEGIPSREGSSFFKSELDTTDERMFSLQNMAIRMSQIGNGLFFNEIEKDRGSWMNPQDWKMQKGTLEGSTRNTFNTNSNTTAISIRKTKNDQQQQNSNIFKFDFDDSELLSFEDAMNSNKNNIASTNRKGARNKRENNRNTRKKLTHQSMISIDFHYKPAWLLKTSYLDLKELEEYERQLRQRQIQQEEEQYKGFEGDDEDFIHQIDEQTLLGATPGGYQSQQTNFTGAVQPFEIGNPNIGEYNHDGDQHHDNNYIDPCGDIEVQQTGTQRQNEQIYTNTQQTSDHNSQQKKKVQVRKMKIQELKSRLWTHLDSSIIHGDSESLGYAELIKKLELQKGEQASIQSCLVAVLHLCNEHNLTLSQNSYDNFSISYASKTQQQYEQLTQDSL